MGSTGDGMNAIRAAPSNPRLRRIINGANVARPGMVPTRPSGRGTEYPALDLAGRVAAEDLHGSVEVDDPRVRAQPAHHDPGCRHAQPGAPPDRPASHAPGAA